MLDAGVVYVWVFTGGTVFLFWGIPNRRDCWVSTSGSGSGAPLVVGPGNPNRNPGTLELAVGKAGLILHYMINHGVVLSGKTIPIPRSFDPGEVKLLWLFYQQPRSSMMLTGTWLTWWRRERWDSKHDMHWAPIVLNALRSPGALVTGVFKTQKVDRLQIVCNPDKALSFMPQGEVRYVRYVFSWWIFMWTKPQKCICSVPNDFWCVMTWTCQEKEGVLSPVTLLRPLLAARILDSC